MAQARGSPAAATWRDNRRGAGFMLIAMAAFALGDATMKLVAEQVPLLQAVALRGLVTLPLMLVLARMTGGLRLAGLAGNWRVVGWRTLAELGATLTFFYCLVSMPLATLSAILQATPLAVTAGAALFMGEAVGWRRGLAILCGFVGVLLIIRPGTDGIDTTAMVALASVGFVVLRDLSTRRLARTAPSVTVAMLAATVVTLVCALLSLRQPWVAVPLSVLPLLGLAAILVVIGYVCVIRVMRMGDVGFTTPFRYSALVWMVLLGWLIWGEFPDGLTLLGAGIVVASGVFTLLREARLHRHPPR